MSKKFVFFSNKVYYVVLVILSILLAITLHNRITHFDDAWCTEQSYWLVKDGYVHSELFRGYNYWHERLYVFHKAFVYIQAPIIYLFGCSIWAARTIPILFSIANLFLLIFYFRRLLEQQLLAVTLYIGCGCLWLFGVDNRPETMTVAFGLGSFILLQYTNKFSKAISIAGVLAGLAGLTHLNGIIYIITGTLWLLLQSNWRKAFQFGVISSLTLSLYLADALGDGNLNRLVYQFVNDHTTKANLHGWVSKLTIMSHYDRLFFHSDGETPLTLLFLFIIAALISRKNTRKLFIPSMQYTLLLLCTFWILTKSLNACYYLLFVPFIIISIIELIFFFAPILKSWQYNIIIATLCLYPLGGVARTRYLVLENKTDSNIEAENNILASHMPCKGTKVIAPIDFFFGQMPNYRIRSLTYYQMIEPDSPPLIEDFFSKAAQDSVRYIICDYREGNQVYHIPRNAPTHLGTYKRVFQDKWRGIYEWQPKMNKAPVVTPKNR